MANRKQLAILKQGVAAWNKWREENPDAKIDLRGAKLDGLDLSGANFRNIDITGTTFTNCTLIQTDFSESRLGIPFVFILANLSITINVLLPIIILCLSVYNYNNYRYIVKLMTLSFFELLIANGIVLDLLKKFFCCYEEDFNFYRTNFSGALLRNASFNNAIIESCVFDNSDLTGISLKNVNKLFYDKKLRWISYKNTIIEDKDIRNLFVYCSGRGISLKGKNLKGAYLGCFDLCDTDFRETKLMQADLRGADITGAKLWGSTRENWIIDGIRCDYVYWDEAGEQRTPPDRDFRPGEFEELYKQLPTFEYVFANGFTPLDPLIMDRVVQAVNEQHKEFSLELVNFDKRGQPHATFTVCRLDYVEKAREQITAGYEANRIAPEKQEQLMDIISKLLDHNTLLAGNQSKSLDIIKQLGGSAMGDIYNISGGQIGAIGQSASASGNIFQQITADLSPVHEEMQRNAKTPEQRAAADDVAKAAQAAQQQNEPAVRQHLKNAGKFALDCTQKIGAEALAEYLKKMTLGL